jgi:hypothetical protein
MTASGCCPFEPGIADVGLVFHERAPADIKPAVLAAPGKATQPFD